MKAEIWNEKVSMHIMVLADQMVTLQLNGLWLFSYKMWIMISWEGGM